MSVTSVWLMSDRWQGTRGNRGQIFAVANATPKCFGDTFNSGFIPSERGDRSKGRDKRTVANNKEEIRGGLNIESEKEGPVFRRKINDEALSGGCRGIDDVSVDEFLNGGQKSKALEVKEIGIK